MRAPTTPAGQQTIKHHNLALVLRLIAAAHHDGGVSRAQVSGISGLTRATVSSLVDELISTDLVIELAPERQARGRPSSPLLLNRDAPVGLGIEISVSYIASCAVDITGAVRAHRMQPVDNRARTPRETADHAALLAEEVRAVLLSESVPIAGIGVAVPGTVDRDAILRRAPNLSNWEDLPIANVLRGSLGTWVQSLSLSVDNEANVAALAQLWYDQATIDNKRDFVHVSGEIGVGGGIVLDGQLFRGVHGYAGEVGHVVVDPYGERCHCGARGCLEQVAGKEAILRRADVSEDDLLVAAAAGDPAVLTVLADAGHALGLALADIINVIDIPLVSLGGFYGQVGTHLVAPIKAVLGERVLSRENVDVRISTLDHSAAVRGSAGVIIQSLIENPAQS